MLDLIVCGTDNSGIVHHVKCINSRKLTWNIKGFISKAKSKNDIQGFKILGGYELIPELIKSDCYFFNNECLDISYRKSVSEILQHHNANIASIIVPGTHQIEFDQIQFGIGCHVGVNAFMEGPTKIGDFVVVRENALISHDSEIGDFSYIGESAILLGRVKVGRNSRIEAGALVRDRITIGNNCVIEQGSVVIRNVPDNTTVKGNPARKVVN